ncbi:unnamed protein product [Urochloa humidicola]
MDPFLIRFFPSVYSAEQDVVETNQYCKFDSEILTLFTSSLYLASLVASIVAGYVTNKCGRRVSMLGGGLIFLAGAILNGFAQNVAMLRRIRGTDDIGLELDDLVAAREAIKAVENPWSTLLGRRYRPQLAMAVLIPTLQQLTGINVVMFYAPVLFGGTASLMSAVITGGVNMFATFVSIATVDRLGRRKLFLQGGIQMTIAQFVLGTLIAIKFGTSGVAEISRSYAIGVVLCICVFVSAFAWSWGPLGWLVPSEIFPLEIRPAAQSVVVVFNMIFTFAIAQVFLMLLCRLKFGLFYFFGAWEIVMTAFVFFFLPETKGMPIEEMDKIWAKHWYWKRFVDDHKVELTSTAT